MYMYVLYIHKTIEPDSQSISIDCKRLFSPLCSSFPFYFFQKPTFIPYRSNLCPRVVGKSSHLPLGFRFVPLSVLPGKTSCFTHFDSTFYGQKLEKRYSAYSSPISVQVLFPNSSQEVESIFERNFSIRINPCPRLTNPKAVRVHNELTT